MNKKLMSLLLTGCMAVSMLPAVAFADDVATDLPNGQVRSEQKNATIIAYGACGNSLMWTLDAEGTMSITGSGEMNTYSSSSPWAKYASQIKKLVLDSGVTSVNGFGGCTNLKTIQLNEGLKTLGSFAGCTSLESITIPSTVTKMDGLAFWNCSQLSSINFNAVNCSDMRSYGYGNVFEGAGTAASSLNVVIGEGVQRIPGWLFRNANITSVTMSDSVQEIGTSAFSDCTSLKTITWSKGLTKIASEAFYNCTALTEVTIPSSVTSIDLGAFANCTNLTKIYYNAVNCADSSTNHYNSRGPFSNAGANAVSLTLEVGSGVVRIPAYMFYGEAISMYNSYPQITTVNLPVTLKEIGAYAFAYCTDLTQLTIPESVTDIGANAFEECSNLKTVYFRGNAPEMGENMFHGVIATAYYPTSGKNWSSVIKNQYGGIITWNSWTPQNVVKTLVSDIFSDVPANAWYTDAVQYVYDTGLMAGTSTTVFSPQGKLTRAMFAQILYNKEGKPPVSSKATFTDVKAGTWYFNAIQWASANGVASGVGGGKFNPNGNLTREQLATMLYNYSGKPSASGSLNKFADSSKVSSWAKTPMIWATSNGVINGSVSGNKTYLNPTGEATRAEAAAMLKNYLTK